MNEPFHVAKRFQQLLPTHKFPQPVTDVDRGLISGYLKSAIPYSGSSIMYYPRYILHPVYTYGKNIKLSCSNKTTAILGFYIYGVSAKILSVKQRRRIEFSHFMLKLP